MYLHMRYRNESRCFHAQSHKSLCVYVCVCVYVYVCAHGPVLSNVTFVYGSYRTCEQGILHL